VRAGGGRRRGLVCCLALSLATTLLPASGASAAAMSRRTAQQIGADGYDYGIALMEFLRQAREQTSVTIPDTKSDAPLNQLGNARQLADASRQVIVQPNNDTLYSMGHVDLSSGPLVLHVPAVPAHRYYSFEFLDPYTNVFAYVGTRTTGDGAGNYVLTGPGFKGRLPAGLHRIRSGYRRAWLVGRTLVNGPGDLASVHHIQNGYRLIPLAQFVKHGLSWRPPPPAKIVTPRATIREPAGIAFFDQLGTALAQNPPPARDASVLRELRRVGIGPGLHPSKEHLSGAVLAGLKESVSAGPAQVYALRLKVATASVVKHNGWFVPPADTGHYGTDYSFRAVVALNGIAANRPAEAIYIVGVTDQSFRYLNGAHDYVIHFPAGRLPPARFFWSLTMYDKSFFLVPNPIHRYELASHTRGLVRNRDGSLDIYVQHAPPPGHESNWLPAPQGQFEMTLRLYGPKARALSGSYVYPPIKLVG
jgi:hypothetical protein